MKIGTVDLRFEIKSADQLDRLFTALKELTDAAPIAPPEPATGLAWTAPDPVVEPEPEKVVALPAPKAKAMKSKANGAVTTQDTSPAAPVEEPLSRDDVRARLGLYASKYGMAAAVALVKGAGVDHLDALPVERLPELAALLEIAPDKAS